MIDLNPVEQPIGGSLEPVGNLPAPQITADANLNLVTFTKESIHMPASVHDCIGYLLAQRDDDLTQRVRDHLLDLELQVNVSAAGGELVEEDGKRFYSDGCDKWWNIRIPKAADTDEPSWKDYPLTGTHLGQIRLIGSTGWDWRNRRSLWLGFDFDAITGHAKGVGVDDQTLNAVLEAAKQLPWIESRRSKGGSGVHLYAHCLVEGITNHTVHAALGRTLLGMMAYETGFDFQSAVDVPGGNMWVWCRDQVAPNGFDLLKAATTQLTETDLPSAWRDHVDVVTKRRPRVRIRGVQDDDESAFQQAVESRPLVALSPAHKATIKAIQEYGPAIYVADYGLVQTHTAALAKVKHRGPFSTRSEDIGDGSPNCFMFPEEEGSWKVYKFGLGSPETDTWECSDSGWTWCYFDRMPDLATACRLAGGVLVGNKYGFRTAEQVAKAVELLGGTLTVPTGYGQQPAKMSSTSQGLAIELCRKAGSSTLPTPDSGWAEQSRNTIGCTLDLRPKAKYREVPPVEIIRVVRGPKGEDQGLWLPTTVNGKPTWAPAPPERIKALIRDEVGAAAVDAILSAAERNPWTLVNLPFQTEYPGGRRWNRGSAQLMFDPRPGPHAYWDSVLANAGRSLTTSLTDPEHEFYGWARDANIRTGGDYLLSWLRCLVREPLKPLPGLFFFGEQKSGKSTMYEAACLLLTSGFGYVDVCLTSNDQFNAEIENKVLCGCEEVDLSGSVKAADSIRKWLTGPTVSIRAHYRGTYDAANSFHFMHCAEHLERGYNQPGDTRMTVCHVTKATPFYPNKAWLFDRLREEGPAITHTLLNEPLPPCVDRLRMPAIDTDDKRRAGIAADPVRAFFLQKCKLEHGAATLKKDLREAFHAFVGDDSLGEAPFGRQFARVTNGQCPSAKNSEDKYVYRNVKMI